MTAQVIFLNTGYVPDAEESRRLEVMAEYIQGARNGLYNRISSYSPYERIIEVQRFHSAFRQHIKACNSSHPKQ